MGRREYEKQRAKAATYIGIAQLLQGGAALVNQYYQRERDALKQASLERLQKQEHEYRKERDAKNDEYRQAQLDATKENAESSRAIQQQNADTQKQLAELSATKHADDKAMKEQQLVMSQLSGFNKQVLDIRERVATGKLKPEVGRMMEQTLNTQKVEYLTSVQKAQPELLAKLGYALPQQSDQGDTGGSTETGQTGKSRSQLIEQHLGGDNGYTQQLAALDKQIAERKPLTLDEYRMTVEADQKLAKPTNGGLFDSRGTAAFMPIENRYKSYQSDFEAETQQLNQQRDKLVSQMSLAPIETLTRKVRSGQATPDEKLMLQSLLNPAMQNTTAMTMPTPGVR